jgi:hypothetical protein
MIETSSVARPRLATPSPTIPAHVRRLAEDVRAGKVTVREAQRRLGQTRTASAKRKAASAELAEKARALAGAAERLERYRQSK